MILRTDKITSIEYAEHLETWRGVPYRDGGYDHRGIDCVRFVVRIIDWLHGYDSMMMEDPPKLPKQIALHDPEKADNVVAWLRRRWANTCIWRSSFDAPLDVQPGDLVIVKNQVHPGHALIAGPRRCELWHSLNSGTLAKRGHVFPTSLSWATSTGICMVYRFPESLLCLR